MRAVAVSLSQGARRPLDFVARYGGEEFAVLLPHADHKGAVVQAERLRCLIQTEVEAEGVTASIGIATLENGIIAPQQLIIQADMGLYAAKQLRNCVRHYADLPPDERDSILDIVANTPAAEGRMEEEE